MDEVYELSGARDFVRAVMADGISEGGAWAMAADSMSTRASHYEAKLAALVSIAYSLADIAEHIVGHE